MRVHTDAPRARARGVVACTPAAGTTARDRGRRGVTMRLIPVLALAVLHLVNVSTTAVADQPNTCRSSLDCCGSPCSDGTCKCNHGYTGTFCCALALGECSIALHPNETWTWGAAPRWTATGTVELMAMGLRNRCGINNCALQIASICVIPRTRTCVIQPLAANHADRYNADILQAVSPSPLKPFSVIDKFEPGLPPL